MSTAIAHYLPMGLGLQAIATSVLYGVATMISCRFYERGHEEGPLLPMTVIRPLRGAEEGLDKNLRSVVEADREDVLQVLFAMESADDPAYPIAQKIVGDYPKRDIHVVVTGPSGGRMAKIHNMIEATKAAKHPIIAFSDSDVRPDRDVLIATSNAFAQGADAASALPDATGNFAVTDALVGLCFNHYFLTTAPLLYRLGVFTPMAGGWIVCRKDFLDRMGGLESLEKTAADDFSISMAAKRLGAKAVMLRRFARIHERGGSPFELAQHLMKWSRIMRFSAPLPYLTVPLFTPVFLAFSALVSTRAFGMPAAGYAVLLVAISLWRSSLAWIQDRCTAASFFPRWAYVILPLTDLASIAFWCCSFLSNTVVWRGKKYRLHYGGQVEAYDAKPKS